MIEVGWRAVVLRGAGAVSGGSVEGFGDFRRDKDFLELDCGMCPDPSCRLKQPDSSDKHSRLVEGQHMPDET
jgi:hypothetical protein